MITSVTSATVTATSAVLGWGLALGAGGALVIIALLVALELLGDAPRQRSLRKGLHVAMVPLLFVFALSIVAKALSFIG